jgi:putative FmdB family regulatory protein
LPLYEYRCRKCGIQVEKIRKFSDPPLEICETCGGQLERLLSTSAIQFKGSGWYVTDYARESSPAGATSSESSAASKTNGSSAGEAKRAAGSPKTPSGSKSSSE